MSSKSKLAVAGLGMVIAGATMAIGWVNTYTFLIGSLLCGGGIALIILLGTVDVAKWGSNLLDEAKHDNEYEFDMKGGWDEDGRK